MSDYRVRIASRRVERQLRAAAQRDPDAYGRIRAAIQSLAAASRPAGVVKLAGEGDLYRIRVGDWRVIYRVDDQAREVVVAKVARRAEDTYA